ncbi:MAG: DUF6596 domain-containing protein [Pseudomonadota bacterium]
MTAPADIHALLDETVRRERGWLISSLVSRLGPANVDLAEDVAQDAIVKALATWPYKGIPDHPRAWLRRVAGNAAIDRIRRSARELGVDDDWDLATSDADIITPSLSDPELDLMVLCCDPMIAPQDQLYLALKTVCGFTAAETAKLFFLKEDALSQRLARAKRQLRTQSGEIARYPTRFALKDRLPALLKIIYLMFSWGYLPRRGDNLYRDDLCREALRLSSSLLAQTDGEAAGHHALHALLLFQMARQPARLTADGRLATLDKQDRTRWDRGMLIEALSLLEAAQASPELTRYHLEAGIASIHAKAPTWEATDWRSISRLYTLLEQYAGSISVTVSRGVSLIYAGELADAEVVLDALHTQRGVEDYPGYHLARAKLAQARGNTALSLTALRQARDCEVSDPVAAHILRETELIDVPV